MREPNNAPIVHFSDSDHIDIVINHL